MIKIPTKIEFEKIPYSIFSKTNGKGRPSAFARSIFGTIFAKESYTGECESTYNDFSKAENCGRATVARSLRTLLKKGLIEKISNSRYKVKNIEKSKGYITKLNFLKTTSLTFKVDNVEFVRCLRPTEFDVFSLILSYSIPQKDKKAGIRSTGVGYCGSIRNIARLLCMEACTVASALKYLHACDLIHHDTNVKKGRNGYDVLTYYANKDIVVSVREQMRSNTSETETPSKEVQNLNEETDRQRYYASNREKANTTAQKKNTKLRNNPDYATIRHEYDKNIKKEAESELAGDTVAIQKIKSQQFTFAKTMIAIAKALYPTDRISEDGTVLPTFTCPTCEDTGYKSDGQRCNCYQTK